MSLKKPQDKSAQNRTTNNSQFYQRINLIRDNFYDLNGFKPSKKESEKI
jgi:hypothetical protein